MGQEEELARRYDTNCRRGWRKQKAPKHSNDSSPLERSQVSQERSQRNIRPAGTSGKPSATSRKRSRRRRPKADVVSLSRADSPRGTSDVARDISPRQENTTELCASSHRAPTQAITLLKIEELLYDETLFICSRCCEPSWSPAENTCYGCGDRWLDASTLKRAIRLVADIARSGGRYTKPEEAFEELRFECPGCGECSWSPCEDYCYTCGLTPLRHQEFWYIMWQVVWLYK